MNITEKERIMYEVMRSVYSGGIPISFKGSMVLRACLIEAGYTGDIRHTKDIDANWNSDVPPSTEEIAESLQDVLDKNHIELKVIPYREYGEKRSAGFNLIEPATNKLVFTMDVDVNRPTPLTKIYKVGGLRFQGAAPLQILTDKIMVASTDKVFRRIKDVIDLYYLSKIFDLDTTAVLKIAAANGRVVGTFHGFLHREDDLKHSYEKFRLEGNVNKPPFDEIYQSVKTYLQDIIDVSKNT